MRLLNSMQRLIERIFLKVSLTDEIHRIKNEITVTTTNEQNRTRKLEKQIKSTVVYKIGQASGRITIHQ